MTTVHDTNYEMIERKSPAEITRSTFKPSHIGGIRPEDGDTECELCSADE